MLNALSVVDPDPVQAVHSGASMCALLAGKVILGQYLLFKPHCIQKCIVGDIEITVHSESHVTAFE